MKEVAGTGGELLIISMYMYLFLQYLVTRGVNKFDARC